MTGRATRLRRARASRIGMAAAGLWLLLGSAAAEGPHPAADTLAGVEEKVRGVFPDVAHMGPMQLGRLMERSGGAIVLVDARGAEEFAVSRIAGAVNVDPGLAPEAVLARLGDLRGKTIVVYCAVGLRSSRLALIAGKVLRGAGAAAVYNLSGGVFRWHNEGRPLVDDRGATEHIHPYRRIWQRYVVRQDRVRGEPRP